MTFFADSSPKQKQPEPAPTRDSAADAVEEREKAESLRRSKLAGRQSTMLTGSYGVPTEITGSRSLASG